MTYMKHQDILFEPSHAAKSIPTRNTFLPSIQWCIQWKNLHIPFIHTAQTSLPCHFHPPANEFHLKPYFCPSYKFIQFILPSLHSDIMATDNDRLEFYTHNLIPFLKNSKTFLGSVDFPDHFKALPCGTNQIFVEPGTNTEKRFLIFGEVASAERGTKLGAIGNHYHGSMKYDNMVFFPTYY